MKNNAQHDLDALITELLTGENMDMALREEQLDALRTDPATCRLIDARMLQTIAQNRAALHEADRAIAHLTSVCKKLTAPPRFPGIFLGLSDPGGGQPLEARVHQGNLTRIVGLAEGIDPAALHTGDEVHLGQQLNVILARASKPGLRGGELCKFDRRTSDGWLVVKMREEEELLVLPTPQLLKANLQRGDLLSVDRSARVAFSILDRPDGSQLFLQETPTETFDQIGGLNTEIEKLKDTLVLHWKHDGIARKYKLRRKGSILMFGPAGVGKTMMARAIANFLRQIAPDSAGRSLFINIKPGALHSMWYSQSEANYREVFRIAREAGAANPGIPIVIFFDEVDSIAAVRGHSHMRIHDNVLTAFMAELDGLESRGNILVVGATNRREAVDPALLRPGRLGDFIMEIPRPNQKAARDIFGKYLDSDLPYARNGCGDDMAATRAEMIESAVTRIYAPNADHDLANIVFRDGQRRVVRPADMISGATIANIARTAVERACLREVKAGQPEGLTWQDLSMAIADEFETAARILNPQNCRSHLSGLPQDVDVVSVELVARKVARPDQFLNAA